MYHLQGEQYASFLKTKRYAKLFSMGSFLRISFVVNVYVM